LIARRGDARWQSYGSMATTMRRNPAPRLESDNRPSTRAGVARRRGQKSGVVSRISPTKLIGSAILDDLPQPVPVSQRELDVIETYLGDLLDETLGRSE
jgi:hypothetical protein